MVVKPSKVALYCRVSTLRQATKGESLDTQLATLITFAKSKGYAEPFCLYLEAGISGKSLKARPAMRQLLEDCEAKRIAFVCATKLDRAFRNAREAIETMHKLQKWGVDLALLNIQADTTTAAGRLIYNVLASVAEFEGSYTGEKIHEVNQHIAAGGRWVGNRPPFGYRYNKATKLLEVEEEQAAIVREIFTAYANGEGSYALARRLNNRGESTKFGALFVPVTILRMIRTPTYKGEVHYEGVQVQGLHEAIVSPELWEQANRQLKAKELGGRPASLRSSLSGLVYCGTCGSKAYLDSASRNRRLFSCSRHRHYGVHACDGNRRMTHELLEEAVTDAVERNLRSAEKHGFKGAKRQSQKPTEDRQAKRSYWERYRQNNNEMYRRQSIPFEEWQEADTRAVEELKRLGEGPPAKGILNASDPALLQFREALTDEEAAPHEQQRIMRLFVERVMLEKEAITVHYRGLNWQGWSEVEVLVRPKRRKRGKRNG